MPQYAAALAWESTAAGWNRHNASSRRCTSSGGGTVVYTFGTNDRS